MGVPEPPETSGAEDVGEEEVGEEEVEEDINIKESDGEDNSDKEMLVQGELEEVCVSPELTTAVHAVRTEVWETARASAAEATCFGNYPIDFRYNRLIHDQITGLITMRSRALDD